MWRISQHVADTMALTVQARPFRDHFATISRLMSGLRDGLAHGIFSYMAPDDVTESCITGKE